MECFKLLLEHLAWIKHQFLKAGSLWGMMRGVGGVSKSIDQSWLAKGLGLGLLCLGFKGIQEEIPREEASTLQIGSVAFLPGQCTSPQLYPCHRLFDQDGHQDFLSLPTVQTLLPVTFAYSLSSQAVVMRQGDERGCEKGHWHAHTRGLPWGLPEVVEMVQQVHCSRRRLLWKVLEFHACGSNKSAQTKKVWKLIICTSYFFKRGVCLILQSTVYLLRVYKYII